jgi:zinc D-Ala-D-Ala dipeptidase
MKIFQYSTILSSICLLCLISCKSESLNSEQQSLTDKNVQIDRSKDNATITPKGDRQQPSNKIDRTETQKDHNIGNPKSIHNSQSEDPLAIKNSLFEKNKSQSLSNPKQWTEILNQPTNNTNNYILIDFPYATSDNFVRTKLYSCSRCFLRPDVAIAVNKAHKDLQKKGYGLKLFDCYRPHKVQEKMWKIKPDERYVGNPKKGSDHNRGIAVDLTIVDRNGKPIDMGTPFDDFSLKAHHTYSKSLPAIVVKNRLLLKNTMASVGFHHVNTEWWHYAWNVKGKKPNITKEEWTSSYPKLDRSNPKKMPGT